MNNSLHTDEARADRTPRGRKPIYNHIIALSKDYIPATIPIRAYISHLYPGIHAVPRDTREA